MKLLRFCIGDEISDDLGRLLLLCERSSQNPSGSELQILKVKTWNRKQVTLNKLKMQLQHGSAEYFRKNIVVHVNTHV